MDQQPEHGRLMHPKRPLDDDSIPPIPESVLLFRKLLNQFKHAILSQLDAEEVADTKDAQKVERFYDAEDRIQQLANILKNVLSLPNSRRKEEVKKMEAVLGVFSKNGFHFEALDDEASDLCMYYVRTDMDMYPFDLNSKHINSHTAKK